LRRYAAASGKQHNDAKYCDMLNWEILKLF